MKKMRPKELGNLPKVTQLRYGSSTVTSHSMFLSATPHCFYALIDLNQASCFLISENVEFLGCILLLRVITI